MSVTAECILRNRFINGDRLSAFQFTDHFEDSFMGKGEHNFNLITADGDQLEVYWTIQSFYHDDYFEWIKIKLNKYNKPIHGNFVIHAEKIKFNDAGSFDTNSSPSGHYTAAIECSDTQSIKITIFIIYSAEIATLSQLSEDFNNFFDNQEFHDVTFDIRGEEIAAHKQILAARSEKFSELFSDLMQKRHDRIEIDDVEPSVFRLFLRFVYGARLDTNSVTVDEYLKLMEVANNYKVESLISFCAQYLCTQVNVDNAAKILMSADFVGQEILKKRCIELILKNKEKVADTEGYKEMVKSSRADLLSEIFLRAATDTKNLTLA